MDHKPEGRPSRGGQCKFESLDPEDFETAKACQKEKFKYRKSRAGCDGEAPAAGVGQASAATGVVRAGGLEPPSPRASVVQAPPRPHERAARLVREWAERAENPVVFNQEQMEMIALVVGQVERIVSHREAVERGDSPEPPEQMVLLLHGQGGSGKTEVVSLLRRLLREVFNDGGELAVASSNSAARVIGGETIHSALKMSAQQSLSIDKLAKVKVDNDSIDRLSALEAVIVEEVSMVPSALLGALSYRLCRARKITKGCDPELYTERGHMFGGVPIVMFLGDFYQLGPVRKGGIRSSLLHRLPNTAPVHARNGQRIFLYGVHHAMI